MIPIPDEKEQRALRVRKNKLQGVSYEKRVLRKLGAKRVVLSGASSVKGDGRLMTPHGLVFIECKYQTKREQSFLMRRFWLEKVQQQSAEERIPFWLLVFRSNRAVDDFAIFPYEEPYSSIVRLPAFVHYRPASATFITLTYTTMLLPYTHPHYGNQGLVLLTFANDTRTYAIGLARAVVDCFMA